MRGTAFDRCRTSEGTDQIGPRICQKGNFGQCAKTVQLSDCPEVDPF
jgi:hypothetical protein